MPRTQTSETNPEGGGKMITAGGGYHFVIEKVDPKWAEGKFQVKCNVVAGEHEDQVGKEANEFFSIVGKAAGRALTFACAVGLYSTEQWAADKAAGIDPDIDYEAAEGRQFCATITMKPYAGNDEAKRVQNQGKMFPNMDFNLFSVWDKRAEKIPKCPKHIALLQQAGGAPPQGQGPATGGSAGSGVPNQPHQPTNGSGGAANPQQPVGAGAGGNKWAGF